MVSSAGVRTRKADPSVSSSVSSPYPSTNHIVVCGAVREDMCIHTDPEEAILAEDEPYILPHLGFWLPNGAQIKDFVGPWMNRYNELKSVYEVTTGNSWPGDPGVENAVARLLAIESGQLQN